MKLLRQVAKGLFWLSACVCLPGILIILTADVILRYGFGAPIRWGQEFAVILLFLSLVLALPQSWLNGVHISADFFQYLMSIGLRRLISRVTWFFVLITSVAIVWQCWKDAQFMLLINESTPELFVPLAYLRGVLAASAVVSGLIALRMLMSRNPVMDLDGNEEDVS